MNNRQEQRILKLFDGPWHVGTPRDVELSVGQMSKKLGWWFGLMGFIYPALYRLERRGVLTSRKLASGMHLYRLAPPDAPPVSKRIV